MRSSTCGAGRIRTASRISRSASVVSITFSMNWMVINLKLKVKLMDGAPLPKHAKPGDAGLDLTTRENATLFPGETKMVGTGVAVEIPEGYFGLLAPRS